MWPIFLGIIDRYAHRFSVYHCIGCCIPLHRNRRSKPRLRQCFGCRQEGCLRDRITYCKSLPVNGHNVRLISNLQIIIAGVIYGHVAAKLIYVRIFRGTKHMSTRTWLAQGSWMGITLVIWVIAFIIAESIPDFNDLLALISSLFASWFTYGLSGVFWLFLNYGKWFSSPRKTALTCLNWGLFGIGLCIMGAGLYSSGKAIHDESGSSSWSCADNSSG